jgi:hypothetical protein
VHGPQPDSGASLGHYQTRSPGLYSKLSISLYNFNLQCLICQVSSNFAEYFDKLSQRINQLNTYCPRLSEYKRLFQTSTRLQEAISAFYAIVVKFCSKALGVVQEKGKSHNLFSTSYKDSKAFTFIGVKRYSKSAWKSFKVDFKDIEEGISEAKDEVTEELRLASEQEAHNFRRLLTREIEENKKLRMEQIAEMQENKDFRSQQTLELQRSGARQIQKILKETGNWHTLMRGADFRIKLTV